MTEFSLSWAKSVVLDLIECSGKAFKIWNLSVFSDSKSSEVRKLLGSAFKIFILSMRSLACAIASAASRAALSATLSVGFIDCLLI